MIEALDKISGKVDELRWDENDRMDEMLFCMPSHVVPIWMCAFWHRQLFFHCSRHFNTDYINLPMSSFDSCSIYIFVFENFMHVLGGKKQISCLYTLAEGIFFFGFINNARHSSAFTLITMRSQCSLLTTQSCCFNISVYPLIRKIISFLK